MPPACHSLPLRLRILSDSEKKANPRINPRVRFFGLPDRIRTYGLQSRSLSLYPAGLRVDIMHHYIIFIFVCQVEKEGILTKRKKRKKRFSHGMRPRGGSAFPLCRLFTKCLQIVYAFLMTHLKRFAKIIRYNQEVCAVAHAHTYALKS